MKRPDESPASVPEEALVALHGDTYPLRAQPKAMGALWDSAQRLWKIAPQKAAQAQALVDHRPAEPLAPAAPPPWPEQANPDDDLPPDLADPFEQAGKEPPLVALSGNTYAVKEALKALGARWDGEQRVWLIREDKAQHARAIIDNQASGGQTPLPIGRGDRSKGTCS